MTREHIHTHHHGHGMVDLIDLEAAISARRLTGISEWVRDRTTAKTIHHILDIGTGTGAGAIALAGLFTGANVVAVDISADMLHRVRDRVAEAGLQSRVTTMQLDMSGSDGFPTSFDLVWASSTLHEVDDPDSALHNIFDALDPGGFLAVVEMDAAPTYLPDTAYEGLESRIHHILARNRLGHPDHPDWTQNLTNTGFELIARQQFSTDERPDGGGEAGRLAHTYLTRLDHYVRPELSAPDRTALEALLADNGPQSLLHRDDLHIRGTRTAWLARRP